ncbi:flagellar hook-length control protein FliK [Fictibacillus aquaticus]|uniref:Flagellar hook-length control protein-like C-terminal domain-containing protein n=1 Tax=Fictibacillus aquaticus TaxID=2021314 RepID=A0A235FCW3_9BACL|nr:flagellar hook-length control protein FliK [Fictibacillus aquaticus]OYD58854.1 hypothetical protein CGZ90_02830 [Fictibacillus aquaticus]
MEAISLRALNGSTTDAAKPFRQTGSSDSGNFFALLSASITPEQPDLFYNCNPDPDAVQLSESFKGLLPEGEELWKESMLESENVQELLAMLPPSLREEIEIFFHSLQENQLSGSALSDEGITASLMLSLLHHQEKGNLPNESSKEQLNILQSIKKLAAGDAADQKAILAAVDRFQKNVLQANSANSRESVLPAKHNIQELQLIKAFYRHNTAQQPAAEAQIFQPGVMTSAEQLSLQLPSNSKAAETQFLREFQSILLKGKIAAGENGTSSLKLHLNPENLGSIKIEIIHKHGEMTARITASTEAAKEALESHLHSLKSALSSQKIELEKLDVFVQEKMHYISKEQRESQHQEQQQRDESKKENSDKSSHAFSDILELLNERV